MRRQVCSLIVMVMAIASIPKMAGGDCGYVSDGLGDLCTYCNYHINGMHFRCTESHIYEYCVWTPWLNWTCAENPSNSCGGLYVFYNTFDECYSGENPMPSNFACGLLYGKAAVNYQQPCGI